MRAFRLCIFDLRKLKPVQQIKNMAADMWPYIKDKQKIESALMQQSVREEQITHVNFPEIETMETKRSSDGLFNIYKNICTRTCNRRQTNLIAMI